jgi:hypothetical protein
MSTRRPILALIVALLSATATISHAGGDVSAVVQNGLLVVVDVGGEADTLAFTDLRADRCKQ